MNENTKEKKRYILINIILLLIILTLMAYIYLMIKQNKETIITGYEYSTNIIVSTLKVEKSNAEKEAQKAKAVAEGKPEAIAERIVEGRMDKFFSEICLLDQPFVKDPDQTVGQLLTELISKIGENIVIRRFVRFERGEGIEKKEENFAEEVMKQIKG